MRRWLFGVSLRACGPRRRPRSRCLKSLLSTPGWRVYLLSKKFKEILGSFLCFFCAFRFLFIFFIKWDITVILQLRRGLKFGRLFERESDAAEFPFVIWTPTNRIKKRMSSPDDAYRHHPPFVDQNTTEGTLRSCGVSVTEIFRAKKFFSRFRRRFYQPYLSELGYELRAKWKAHNLAPLSQSEG